MMTEDERRKIGIEVGRQIKEILDSYPLETNQEAVEVLGVALFWYMGLALAHSKAFGGSDEGSSAV